MPYDDDDTSDSEDERYINRPAKKQRAVEGPAGKTRSTGPVQTIDYTSLVSAGSAVTGPDYSSFAPLTLADDEELPIDMLRVYVLPIVVNSTATEETTGGSRSRDKDFDNMQVQAMRDPHSANNLHSYSPTKFNEQVLYLASHPMTMKVLVDEALRSIAKNYEVMMNIILKMIEVLEKYRYTSDEYEEEYNSFITRLLDNDLHHMLLVKGIRMSEKWISKTYIDKCYKIYLLLVSTNDRAFQELVREAPLRNYQLTDTMLYMMEHHSQAASAKSFNRQIVSLLIKIFHFILCEAEFRDPTCFDFYRIASTLSAYHSKFQSRLDPDILVKMNEVIALLTV